MRKISLAATLVFASIGLGYFSCGKGTDKKADESTASTDSGTESKTDSSSNTAVTAGTVAIDTVNSIVQLTDPVKAFAASDVSPEATTARSFDNVAIQTGLLDGTKGILFGQSTADIKALFGTAGSKAYCNAINNGMKFFKEVSTADFNLCILKKVAGQGQPIKADEAQIWDFKIAGQAGSFTYRMKFSIQPTANGGIQSFENFICQGQGSAALTQESYVKQTVDAGKIQAHVRSQGDHGDGLYRIRVDMNGQLGEDGRPVGIKAIDYAESGKSRNVHVKAKQSAANLEIIGYETNSSSEEQFIRFVELLDENAPTEHYMITKLGYGDGAALIRTVTGNASSDTTAGWSGATLAANSDEVRIAKVKDRAAEFRPSTGDDRNLDFTAAETYDCTGAADYTFEGQMPDFNECGDAFNIDQNGSSMCNDVAD